MALSRVGGLGVLGFQLPVPLHEYPKLAGLGPFACVRV